MRQEMQPASRNRISGAVLLAFVLVAGIWVLTYFGAEARVRRATGRLVTLAEKSAEESPVAQGLAANRLGKFLATNAVLELADYGRVASGRQEIVSLFAQVRAALAVVSFSDPEIAVVARGNGEMDARVEVRYRMESDAGDFVEGDGKGELHWAKGKDGWQIVRTVLHPEEGTHLPGGWK